MKRVCVFLSLLCILIALGLPTAASAQSIPNWQPNTSYAIGALVMYNGVEYQCIQAHTSQVGWEPPNVPALWKPVSGGGGSCTSVPGAPTGLSASSTSSSGTTLNWNAVTPPSSCSISSYTVLQNGTSIGSTSSTSFSVSGLSASTTYNFTVEASDSAGTSGQSSAVGVTTSAGGGGGGGCAAPWSSTQVYTGGMTANVNGVNYVANWWTQNQNPATNNGPAGSGQPWTSQGSCSACSTKPSAPTSLSASGTTGSSTTLSWHAATVASNCSVTGYTVYENGNAVGSASNTSFVVTGLSPQTTYTFAVAASDQAGASPQSLSIQVTTGSGGGGGGGGKLFAPYIDMSLTTDENLTTIQQQSGLKGFTLAFLVSNGGCAVGWGGLGGTLPTDTLPNGTSIGTLVSQLQAQGVTFVISFGGANGSDPAGNCSSASALQAVYQQVLNQYHVKMLDFDIEGGAVSNQAAITQRDKALVGLKAANPGLIVSYTLPVEPTGLVNTGVSILNSAKSDGLALDVVNVMAMDYGSANDNNGQMGLDATNAASATESQIQQAGLSSTVGVTPMIGVNDTNTEVFRLADANTLLNFTNSNSYITRLAMWSVARDNGGCAGQGFASPTCSGISQNNYQFSQTFETF
jgi:chitodextrinase